MLKISRQTLNNLYHAGKIQGKQLTPGGKQLYLLSDDGVAVPPVKTGEVLPPEGEDTESLLKRCLALTGKALGQLEKLAVQKSLDSSELASLEKLTKIVLAVRIDSRDEAKLPRELVDMDLKQLIEKAKPLLLEDK
jgi:hypothetical protein